MRFTHLQLQNWRNFRAMEGDLAGRVFLVGPNASGKSNMLDAFRFLHDIVDIGGGFQEAVTRRGGVKRLRCLAARKNPAIQIRVEIGDAPNGSPPEWEYDLEFSQTAQRQPEIRRERVLHNGEVLLTRPVPEDREDPARLRQTHLEQVNVNREFREVADFLRSVRYLHIVPQLVRDTDRYVGKERDPYGGDFLERIADTQARTRDARLRRIVEALRVAVPQLQELRLDQERGEYHLAGRYEHWRPQGAWQSEADFSDGTLRLFGLLWAFLDGSGPLLLEEPELSLHPDVVRHIPQVLARMERKTQRQVFLSTHSSDLLSDEGIGLDEVLLLLPRAEGTEVRPASSIGEVHALLEGGLTLADALLPYTRPSGAEQLSFFFGK